VIAQEIIRRKRDGGTHPPEEIREVVHGITTGDWSDAQVASWAMAAFLNGLGDDERVALTGAMRDSGTVLKWHDVDAPILDKHSTGGVGDKVSLILAPIVAACGGAVPMISGRGLGHTGGTLDKLDAIPGYVSQPDVELLRATVRDVGCAIVGQTADLAPADRRLYALRDATATVESLPLIVASILSKKLAAGLQGLVMDVKTGSGAFMPTREQSAALARALVETAEGNGLPCAALLTDMDQVLGRTAGNALEVRESIAVLRGENGEPRLEEVTLELSARLLCLGGLAHSHAAALEEAEAALRSGDAAERFARMVAALGGPTDLLDDPDRHLPTAPHQVPAPPARGGRVGAIDVREVGLAVLELGGGRRRETDRIDPAVGLTEVAGLGEEVGPDRPLAVIHARTPEQAQAAAARLREAFKIADTAPDPPPLVEAL
jgi:thymidine phosphorylase